MTNFRIRKRAKDGKYVVEKQTWFGWKIAIYFDRLMVGCIDGEFDTVEEARAAFQRVYQDKDEVVEEFSA